MIGERGPAHRAGRPLDDRAPEVERVWRTAAEMGYGNVFIPSATYEITDDHLPLLNKGLRVIDVIDLAYSIITPSTTRSTR